MGNRRTYTHVPSAIRTLDLAVSAGEDKIRSTHKNVVNQL